MHRFQHIVDLANYIQTLPHAGVVVSPGSRNAPVIHAFLKAGVEMHSIIDERSAAYFALGKALARRKPAILICTSGTAALNYAPAVAEAFFQKVPLLVLTADRPAGWIGHQDNQAIYQENIYGKNCRKSYSLPCAAGTADELTNMHRVFERAYAETTLGEGGPVHINIPLDEPLYTDLPHPSEMSATVIEHDPSSSGELTLLQDLWNGSTRKMIVVGQHPADSDLLEIVKRISQDSSVIVVAEPLSNIHGKEFISRIEPVFARCNAMEAPPPAPDLVMYFGGQVISQSLKTYLRSLTACKFVYISSDSFTVDTYRQSPVHIHQHSKQALSMLEARNTKNVFLREWQKILSTTTEIMQSSLEGLEFSDLVICHFLSKSLPPTARLFVGNSSIIRYLQMFDMPQQVFSNRGTSGIDGCLSTAVGLASSTKGPVFALLGDISFLYDTNALLNTKLPTNLKIIVINNNGGGIFRLLTGPSEIENLLPYQETPQHVRIGSLCQAYGVNYFFCDKLNCLGEELEWLLKSTTAGLLEIKTPVEMNPKVFKEFNQRIKNM